MDPPPPGGLKSWKECTNLSPMFSLMSVYGIATPAAGIVHPTNLALNPPDATKHMGRFAYLLNLIVSPIRVADLPFAKINHHFSTPYNIEMLHIQVLFIE